METAARMVAMACSSVGKGGRQLRPATGQRREGGMEEKKKGSTKHAVAYAADFAAEDLGGHPSGSGERGSNLLLRKGNSCESG